MRRPGPTGLSSPGSARSSRRCICCRSCSGRCRCSSRCRGRCCRTAPRRPTGGHAEQWRRPLCGSPPRLLRRAASEPLACDQQLRLGLCRPACACRCWRGWRWRWPRRCTWRRDVHRTIRAGWRRRRGRAGVARSPARVSSAPCLCPLERVFLRAILRAAAGAQVTALQLDAVEAEQAQLVPAQGAAGLTRAPQVHKASAASATGRHLSPQRAVPLHRGRLQAVTGTRHSPEARLLTHRYMERSAARSHPGARYTEDRASPPARRTHHIRPGALTC